MNLLEGPYENIETSFLIDVFATASSIVNTSPSLASDLIRSKDMINFRYTIVNNFVNFGVLKVDLYGGQRFWSRYLFTHIIRKGNSISSLCRSIRSLFLNQDHHTIVTAGAL